MIKGFTDKFKVRSGHKYLKDGKVHAPKSPERKKGISKIGCIVDVDSFSNAEQFYELIDEFSLKSNSVKIIGFKRDLDKNSPYAIQMFTTHDLGWKGVIENGYVLEFESQEYDMLINYYTEENLLMNLLSLRTRARLRVGFGSVDTKYNDLILNTPMHDFTAFKRELKKYLEILKEV